MKPIIGIIPTYNSSNKDNDPYQDKISFVTMYINKIKESGGIPVGILDPLNLDIYDGYVWPGGNKILFSYRSIIKDAIKNNKPILGVCLGCESIATILNIDEDAKLFSNKSLSEVYDLTKEANPYLKPVENHWQYSVTKNKDDINKARHKIKIKKDSLLYSIMNKETLEVVSLHHMGINRLPSYLKVSAKCNNVIEAFEYQNLILGVQFHPEIEEYNNLFDWLIKTSRKGK